MTDYQVSWALSQFKAAGDITNPTRGVWELTERGRDRLAAEEAAYDIADYLAYSQAMVVSAVAQPAKANVSKDVPRLQKLAEQLGASSKKTTRTKSESYAGPRKNAASARPKSLTLTTTKTMTSSSLTTKRKSPTFALVPCRPNGKRICRSDQERTLGQEDSQQTEVGGTTASDRP